jgi:di/tricarboxylate transporter
MPDLNAILVLAVAGCAMVLFVTEKLRVDLVAMLVLLALVLLGLIPVEQALYGFANPATATVAAMFVLSAGMARTGLVQWLARRIDRLAGSREGQLVLVLCLVIAGLSAFIVNTATVAIFIPVAIALAKSRKLSPSRVLMPLSFASQFGGVCTLIGTSTNILVSSIAVASGLAAFGLFEFAPLGLVMSGAGILYLVLVGRRALPQRAGAEEKVDRYRLTDYLAEFSVTEKSSLVGKTWFEAVEKEKMDVELIKRVRGMRSSWGTMTTEIQEGDVLLVHGDADRLMELKDQFALETAAEDRVGDENLSSDEVKLVEALIPPRSRLVARTLRGEEFRRRYGSAVLALQRRGRVVRERLRDVRLEAGDTLLIQGDKEDVQRLMRSSDLVVTDELTELYIRKDKAAFALLLLALVVGLAAFEIVPILVAALIGAVGMVLTRCLGVEEAYQAIDWKIIFLLGGLLPLGLALERTGAAGWLADAALGPFQGSGPLIVLGVLYLVTAVLTETMSNNAAAVLLAPIALSIAASMNVSPRPFLVTITFAASTSFATPIGYQTNTMVYAPGGYRFLDYTKVGGPLNLIFLIIALLLIPVLWPF